MNAEIENNPFHVENLNSIQKLENSGFTGIDVSLEISLFEYELIWREIDGKYLFVYQITGRVNRVFDRCSFDANLNVQTEFDWAKFEDIYSLSGMSETEWNEQELPEKISDLFSYYGYESIFGSSYWEGFTIED